MYEDDAAKSRQFALVLEQIIQRREELLDVHDKYISLSLFII